MFRWFRQGPQVRDTAIAMADPRPGDRVLVLGADLPRFAGETGAITGLNGRTVVVDRGPSAASRIEQAAAGAGALVEFVDAPATMLPLDSGTFDLAVAPNLAGWPPGERPARMTELMRVLRPGGRLVLIAGQKRGGLFGALPSSSPALAVEAVLALFTSAGAIAGRRLAEVDKVAYYEARKPR